MQNEEVISLQNQIKKNDARDTFTRNSVPKNLRQLYGITEGNRNTYKTISKKMQEEYIIKSSNVDFLECKI